MKKADIEIARQKALEVYAKANIVLSDEEKANYLSSVEGLQKQVEDISAERDSFKNENTTLLEGDATEILAELEGEFDMIFMDAAKGQYINFMPDILRLLSPGGILVSDNILQDGDIVESKYAVTRRNRTIHNRMREYLYALTHHEELETVILPVADGVTLSVKKSGGNTKNE